MYHHVFLVLYFYPVENDIPYQTNKKSLWQLQGIFHSTCQHKLRNYEMTTEIRINRFLWPIASILINNIMYVPTIFFFSVVKKETVINGIFLIVSRNLSAHFSSPWSNQRRCWVVLCLYIRLEIKGLRPYLLNCD